MKVLNLYAGIGGNRKLWENVEVTAVELDTYVAETYAKLFKDDLVIVADAHKFLVDHYLDYDFIWTSPPCPTHSRLNDSRPANQKRYPSMELYEEIIFLKHYCKGSWVVENVISYYDPLITPKASLARHYFWANFEIPPMQIEANPDLSRSQVKDLAAYHEIVLPEGTKAQRKMLRNAVNPKLGNHVFNSAPLQEGLF
jgi:DNA (cytosine-5)-methyltransferase 1